MSELTPQDNMLLESLQDLCDDCKAAIRDQDDEALRASMTDVCERCQVVRHSIPELMALRHKAEDLNTRLKASD